MSSPATVRPYTSYNLFFQLEREYILQTLLGFRPTIAPQNVFDPNDNANYSGPPLPSRYNNLILPYDWHIPGKTQRRKRSHRKSHGKIGFHELNEQISKAWSEVDPETRHFCTCLSGIEAKKYKKIRETFEENKRITMENEKMHSTLANSTKNDLNVDFNKLVASLKWTDTCPQEDVASPDDIIGMPFAKIGRVVSLESVHSNQRGLFLQAPTQNEIYAEVDMKDDEIMALWKRTPNDQVTSMHPTHQASNYLTKPTKVPSMYPTHQVSNELAKLTSASALEKEGKQFNTRMVFIDAEYEKFKEIGTQFSSKSKFQGKMKLKALTACQA